MIHYKIRNKLYYIRYRIKNWYYKVSIKIKAIVKPKHDIKLEDAIVITKIEWRNFPYEDFVTRVKVTNYNYHYNQFDVPDKVKNGQFRNNVFYETSLVIDVDRTIPYEPTDHSKQFYVARVDGWYKIEKCPSVNFVQLDYKDRSMVNAILIKFIRMACNYRHKPLQDLLDVVIAQEELELL